MKRKNNEDTTSTIHMTVKDDTDFLSVFSETDTPVISWDVAQFLENSTQGHRHKGIWTLVIRSNCIDDREKLLYKKGVTAYYHRCITAVNRELRRNAVSAAILALLGIAVIGAAFVIQRLLHSPLWTEVVDIIGWVLLWEAVDIIAFKNLGLKSKRRQYRALAAMDIIYEEII